MNLYAAIKALGTISWCFSIHMECSRPSGKTDDSGVRGDNGEWATGLGVGLLLASLMESGGRAEGACILAVRSGRI